MLIVERERLTEKLCQQFDCLFSLRPSSSIFLTCVKRDVKLILFAPKTRTKHFAVCVVVSAYYNNYRVLLHEKKIAFTPTV